MNCPYCKKKSHVSNSRTTHNGSRVWRRRSCQFCQKTWTTIEIIELSTSHTIVNNGHVQKLTRDQIFISIYTSLIHRKTAIEDAGALTDTFYSQIFNVPKVSTNKDVDTIIYDILKKFDKVAAEVFRIKQS